MLRFSLVVIGVTIYELWVVPFFARRGRPITTLRRIGAPGLHPPCLTVRGVRAVLSTMHVGGQVGSFQM